MKGMKYPLFAFLLAIAFLLSGCGAILAAKTMNALDKKADQAVVLANSSVIAAAINVFNAEQDNADNTIKTIGTMQDLKDKLGKEWPDSITDQDAETAIKLVKITNGIASVISEDKQGS